LSNLFHLGLIVAGDFNKANLRNDNTINIQLAGYTLYRQDRTETSGKTRGGDYLLLVNNTWCTISKKVSSCCALKSIRCRPQYRSRESSSVFFVAVYIPPQSEAGTNTTLNELYYAISKQENAHPEAALLVAGDFDAGKLKSV
jgi:hypothetical protein